MSKRRVHVEINLKHLIEKEKAAGRPHTQEELSRILGVTQGTMSRWVGSRVVRIELDILERMCEYFNCNVEDILVTRERIEE